MSSDRNFSDFFFFVSGKCFNRGRLQNDSHEAEKKQNLVKVLLAMCGT